MSNTNNYGCTAGDDLGVHDWSDEHGNYGFELRSRIESKTTMVQSRHIFDYPCPHPQAPASLSSYLGGSADRKARRVCVVVDQQLCKERIAEIHAYLAWCKAEKLVQDFSVTELAVPSLTAKTLDKVYSVVQAAEHLALRRRDFFLAVGGAFVADIVGFAAGTYRRATPWIWVATGASGSARWAAHDFTFPLYYNSTADSTDEKTSCGAATAQLSLSQAPVACFLDLDTLDDSGILPGDHVDGHVYEHVASEDVRYHVSSVSELFAHDNRVLIDGYCQPSLPEESKRKVLMVVEANLGTRTLGAVRSYFERHADSVASFRLLSSHASGMDKDMVSVQRVLDAAISMDMSMTDLLVVVGGGTLMDIVGFAAAMYRGGTPYLRIPTTLVGMIDAGVGVKVGVNFGSHKNFIGRYYAPVACLNDAATFLPSLPPREYACGLAEALKMACIKSPRLFGLIESYQQTLELNAYTHEVVLLAIRTMLEELQPNIYEHSLIRLVDFGHEFGHIIESLALFQIPHGECVAIGMAISSYLAHLTGSLARRELERILDCITSLGLPIWTLESNCCDASVLWDRISAEGIEHKDGMLHLAIPVIIGQGGFLDEITDIDASMLARAMQGLQHYSADHALLSESASDSGESEGVGSTVLTSLAETPFSGHAQESASAGSQESLPSGIKDEIDGSRLTAAVLGASGDIGAALVQYLLDHGAKVFCTVRTRPGVTGKDGSGHTRIERLRTPDHPNLHVLVGYPLDKAILESIILEADVIYNMAAVVSLSSTPADQAQVIGLNGFGQGVVTYMVKALCRQDEVKIVYPSSQRVHLTLGHADIDAWVRLAEVAFAEWAQTSLLPMIQDSGKGVPSQNNNNFDMATALESLATDFIAANPLPRSVANIYELSKRLGEQLVALSARHVLVRISGVYSPSFTRGFAARAARPRNKKSFESVELRDFIYIDDLNKILLKSVFHQPPPSFKDDAAAFDAASGEPIDLRKVWRMARELTGDGAQVVFSTPGSGDEQPEAIKLDTRFAKKLLGRDFTSFEQGFQTTVDGRVRARTAEELSRFHLTRKDQAPFRKLSSTSSLALSSSTSTSASLPVVLDGRIMSVRLRHTPENGFCLDFNPAAIATEGCVPTTAAPRIYQAIKKSLDAWYTNLPLERREEMATYLQRANGLCVRPRPLASHAAEFFIEGNRQEGHRAVLNIDQDLVNSIGSTDSLTPDTLDVVDDIVNQAGHHLVAFVSRGCLPAPSRWEHEHEERTARSWKKLLRPWASPPIIVLDVGSTFLRTAVYGVDGQLVGEPTRVYSPSRRSFPGASLVELQTRLVDTIAQEIRSFVGSAGSHHQYHPGRTSGPLRHAAIGFGAVIDAQGIIRDASIFWGEPGHGYDLRGALTARLPDIDLTIINDVSAAAWRYHEEERFCLITASSGLANKVFDKSLWDGLVLDAAGLGGEMGHVVMEPRLVDEVVAYAQHEAARCADEFSHSRLAAPDAAAGDPGRITARVLGRAAVLGDGFANRLLDDKQVPCCACGTLADLCAYASGRGALERARKYHHAAIGTKAAAAASETVVMTDSWLQRAIQDNHPIASRVLDEAAYPLALRVLQMAADLGLDKFILVGGFALKTARAHLLPAVQRHLVRLCTYAAFFNGWSPERVKGLVRLGVDDDNDVLLGLGHYVHYVKLRRYRAVVKPVGERDTLAIVSREMPRVGEHEILARVVYAGVCSTDMQVLRGERGLEPVVLGHEGVCEVVEVGRGVKGLTRGQLMVLLPNNPLDDSEKLGHNREGLLQEYIKFGQEFVDRGQVLPLSSRSSVCPTMTLVEPLSCVVAAQQLITPAHLADRNVLIVGAGTLGLLFASLSAKQNARNVFLASRSAESLEFAVARGIVPRKNVLAVGAHNGAGQWAESIKGLGDGRGIDTVIVCVSLGQGRRVAQDALSYVNDGGRIHLFGGFCSGDVLDLTPGVAGDQCEIWPIRTQWETKTVLTGPCENKKTVTLSGNRGSRQDHVDKAARLLEQDGPSFGRVISHSILLDAVPEALRELSATGTVGGVAAKRVIVNMAGPRASAGVQTPAELAMQSLGEAVACGARDAVPAGNAFRDLGFDGRQLVLGWTAAPAWQQVRESVAEMLQLRAVARQPEHYIWVGTGPWAFWIDLLNSTPPLPGCTPVVFHSLSSLDPQALKQVLDRVDGLHKVVCIGTTQSGTTIETVALMNTLRERFESASLDYRNHFVWLTDRAQSVEDVGSGEAVIRSIATHDWSGVDMIPLTLNNQLPINALFAVPHSSLVLLSITLRFGRESPISNLHHLYQEYTGARHDVVARLLNATAPLHDTGAATGDLHIVLPDCGKAALNAESLISQLFQQALGSKDVNFHPRVRVTSGSESSSHLPPSFSTISLPSVLPEASPTATALLIMNALNFLCAMIASNRGIQFVTHPAVDLYKKRARELMSTATNSLPSSPPLGTTSPSSTKAMAVTADLAKTIATTLLSYLDADIAFLDIIHYGHSQ
ncbi:2-epi-5-epi-valiolone synthase [Microdochium nivale]|nr:2-epi-5-epi-valiolone synthase [Microdochium nivale]